MVAIIFLAIFLLDATLIWLNMRRLRPSLPASVPSSLQSEFETAFPSATLERSMRYLKETSAFEMVSDATGTMAFIAFLILGGFGHVDMIARSLDAGLIFSGLAFVFLLSLLQGVFSLPFSLYSTFIIEQNYGFNTTTLRTFTMDLLKGLVVGAILGGLLFAGVLAAFMFFGPSGWLLAWLGTTVFQIIILFLAPAYLLPLFNKFTPLPEGSLRSKLESYAHQQNITLAGVFTMDGSKRSTKANAFLAGFGATRRLVLFDTLIERHTEDEVLGVFAHEVGHLKHKHVLKHIAFSTITSAALFGLVGFALTKPELSRAFGVFSPSHYSQLVFVALLWGTIGRFISLIPNAVSRKHEYEADDFAAKTTEKPLDLAKGLIKLTAHAMAPLDPHPLSVLFDYSHPPLLERVKALTRKSTR